MGCLANDVRKLKGLWGYIAMIAIIHRPSFQ